MSLAINAYTKYISKYMRGPYQKLNWFNFSSHSFSKIFIQELLASSSFNIQY